MLQMTKCKNDTCSNPLRTNVQEVLGGKFLPTPLVLSQGPFLLNPKDKSDKSKLCDFLQEFCSPALTAEGV